MEKLTQICKNLLADKVNGTTTQFFNPASY